MRRRTAPGGGMVAALCPPCSGTPAIRSACCCGTRSSPPSPSSRWRSASAERRRSSRCSTPSCFATSRCRTRSSCMPPRSIARTMSATRYSWPLIEQAQQELQGRAELFAATTSTQMQVRLARGTDGAERSNVQLVSGRVLRGASAARAAGPADRAQGHRRREREPGDGDQRRVLAPALPGAIPRSSAASSSSAART